MLSWKIFHWFLCMNHIYVIVYVSYIWYYIDIETMPFLFCPNAGGAGTWAWAGVSSGMGLSSCHRVRQPVSVSAVPVTFSLCKPCCHYHYVNHQNLVIFCYRCQDSAPAQNPRIRQKNPAEIWKVSAFWKHICACAEAEKIPGEPGLSENVITHICVRIALLRLRRQLIFWLCSECDAYIHDMIRRSPADPAPADSRRQWKSRSTRQKWNGLLEE